MTPTIRQSVREALGTDVLSAEPVGGGDINEAYRCTLGGGREIFVKANPRAPETMFAREAAGLRWLAEANALSTPEVLAHGRHFLALTLLQPGKPTPDHAERLGRGLAKLHRFGADGFGWAQDNFLGTLAQDNRPTPDWPTFYRQRRLEPQLKMAVDAGRVSARLQRMMGEVLDRLAELVGPAEPPSRLHGDLWAGNHFVTVGGTPAIIDPAVYGGHREVDLAMMQLFGGFSSRVFDAYQEAWRLGDGWEDRVGLYQLYPLMAHVNLFGGGYSRSVERELSRYV